MPQKASRSKKRRNEVESPADDGAEPARSLGETSRVASPAGLTRTAVYRRVPLAVRNKLDQAILLRPEKLATLDVICREFDLAQRYGISPAALRTYAGKIEQLVRPTLTSQLMAGVLGCLPEDYRRQLLAGSHVLLLSRIIQALNAANQTALPIADLARLGSILSAFAGRTTATKADAGSAKRTRKAARTAPANLPEVVRTLYGLTWPPEEASDESGKRSAG